MDIPPNAIGSRWNVWICGLNSHGHGSIVSFTWWHETRACNEWVWATCTWYVFCIMLHPGKAVCQIPKLYYATPWQSCLSNTKGVKERNI